MQINLKILALSMLMLVAFCKIEVQAEEIKFDPEYYATAYEDVSRVFGNDEAALYQHYITFGIKEGRYANAEDAAAQIKHTEDEIPNIIQPYTPLQETYVDVDINSQTVRYFENNILIFQTPCVSGSVKAGRSTPTGTYKILTKTIKNAKAMYYNSWHTKMAI